MTAVSIFKPELLAPAGSLEAFFAAMEKGADAVYAGLQEFSARARAKNFTLQQMERMLSFAHGQERKIYITLNTLVKEKELPQLVDTLAALAGMRVDGVILQDMGVARLIRNHFPSIPLHASTQMTIHNTPGVKMLERLGFQRGVLARELAIDEISKIASSTEVEIECFVHGALCFSISGQCFFSSLLGGHSGNRGRCAQPCRRLYSHRGKDGHYFSTSDLSAIDMIPELVKAGVKSLKIEGRMKSAEYVASVVEAYRTVLDAPAKSEREALAAAKQILKYSFGRTPTKGFIASQQPDDIANPWQKGGTGRFVGKIKSLGGKSLTFETRDPIYVGDRLRVQPKSDMAGQAWTVRSLSVNRKKCMESAAGSTVEVETPFRFSVGDSIYKVSSREAYTLSDNACLRRLEGGHGEKIPCSLSVSLKNGQLNISAFIKGFQQEFTFQLGDMEASRSSDMQAVLSGQFSKCGETPFRLESLTAPDFPQVLIPSALFKDLRRRFYQQLFEAFSAVFTEQIKSAHKGALKDVSQVRAGTSRNSGREMVTVAVNEPKEWRFPLQNGADFTQLQLTKAVIHSLASTVPRMRGSEESIIWQLPFIIFDRDIALYRNTLESLYSSGFRHFEASNLSHFELFVALKNIVISTGYRCFSLNSQALLHWNELGAASATLYLEDDSANLGDLLVTDLAIERKVIVHSPLPVMTTKIRLKDVHGNTPLRSDRGEIYRVTSQDGLQTISSSLPFSLSRRGGELRQKACRSFFIDLSDETRERWGDIIASFRTGRELPGTTEFNYPAELI
ncbi:MAG: U32 family peptidase [Desulfuromonadaceae bacterium]|nr:U32 family peptidase [Desulfuromonadaceae bacterium]MDD2853977.1 U32 family peptidase [Desulfuromonadaceae bacterium]